MSELDTEVSKILSNCVSAFLCTVFLNSVCLFFTSWVFFVAHGLSLVAVRVASCSWLWCTSF